MVREAIAARVDLGQLLGRLRFNAPVLVPLDAPARAAAERLTVDASATDTAEYLLWKGDWYRQRGNGGRARTYADSARARLERDVSASPDDPGLRARLGLANALLGRKAAALREATRAVELLPVSRDAVDGHNYLQDLDVGEVLVGEYDAAITHLEQLLRIPSDISIPLLRVHPMWAPLRANPRFRRLVRE